MSQFVLLWVTIVKDQPLMSCSKLNVYGSAPAHIGLLTAVHTRNNSVKHSLINV